jgi:hypothetical protein
MSACGMMGEGKVTPVIKRGPPAAALDSPVDVERVAALVPKDNSYANQTASMSLTISGTCISQTVAVKVSVVRAGVKDTLDCDSTSGSFASEIDLSSIPDGEVQLAIGFLKSRDSAAPIYELTRTIIKDTENLPEFTVPASLTESNSGTIAISEVAGAALYRATFTPQGGGAIVGPIETILPAVPVTGLTVGTTYTVSVVALDTAGNETKATNTGTFSKPVPPNPTGLSATAASSSQVNLSWTSGGGSTAGYKIAYATGASAPSNCSSGTVIPGSSITGTSHSVTGLTASTQFSFRVCTVNNDTSPAVSSGATASATTPQAAPPNPTNSIATATSSTQIDLSWTSGVGSTTDYRISYQTGASAPATCATGTIISEGFISGTSHPVTGLSAATQYSFRICAINGNATPDVSSGVTVTATTSAGGGGGQNIGDLNLTYWIQNGSAAGYMYGPVSSSSWTDNASFAPSLSSGYFVVGSALTLGKDSAPWVAVTSTSSGGDFRGDVTSTVNLGGSSFSGNAFTLAANLITGNSPPTGSVSIASVNDGTGYRIVPATGWSLLNPQYTHRYVFNVLPSSGSAFSGMGDWIAGGELHPYDDDGAMGTLASASKAGVLHQVGVRKATSTDPYYKILYGTYSNPGGGWAWSAPAVAALNKQSDASTDCRNATHVALDFDRNNSAHGLHMVYMCEYWANGSLQWQIVHLWNNGSGWISQMAVSDLGYTNYPVGNRLGFSVRDGKALLVYWSADGSLQAKYGTFDSVGGQYNWSLAAEEIATKDSTVQYFLDPQVAIASNGTGRVAYQYRENPGTDSVIAVAHDSTGTWQTLDNLKRAAALRLGQGLGITGLAGNSEQ